MSANEFLAELKRIVASFGGYIISVTDLPNISISDDEILIGGSESDYDPDYIGGENDLLKEDL